MANRIELFVRALSLNVMPEESPMRLAYERNQVLAKAADEEST